MKKYRYTYPVNSTSLPPLQENTLFLDIETTGFQRSTTFLTIIGLAWQERDNIIIEQWLNECRDLSPGIHDNHTKTFQAETTDSLEETVANTQSTEAEQLWNLLEQGSIIGKPYSKRRTSQTGKLSYQRAETSFRVSRTETLTFHRSGHQQPPLSLKEKGFLEERLLLSELEQFLKNKTALPTLVHYNGTTFDLPYLKSKYEQYGMTSTLLSCPSLDLYHCAKKYRYFLQTNGLKQKNLEEAFGLFREDNLTGQELIQTYLRGIDNKNDRLLKLYLLHNKEDMEGMVFLQHLLKVDSFFQGNFQIIRWEKKDALSCYIVQLYCGFTLKRSLSLEWENIHFHLEGGSLFLKIPFVTMEAKYFYPDYKNYYYLPMEDRAIHKSVASFVEKEYRTKATKENCYIKKKALFYPLPLSSVKKKRKACLTSCCELSLFYKEYGDSTAYLPASELDNEKNQILYLKNLLQGLLESCKIHECFC